MKWTLFDIGDKHAPERTKPPEPDDSLSTSLNMLGKMLFGFGLISAILSWLGNDLIVYLGWIYILLLGWVDHWGEDVGWTIRVIACIVGAVLMLSCKATYKEPEEDENSAAD